MTLFESRTVVIATFAAMANFGALLFIGWQLIEARGANRRSTDVQEAENLRRKRQATLDYYYLSFREREKVSERLSTTRRQAPSLQSFLSEAAADADAGMPIRKYLNYWETFSTGVNLGIYDLQTAKKLCGARVRRAWSDYEPYITARRIARSQPRMYFELETLHSRLEELREQEGEQYDIEHGTGI